jgi:hypothetical protein
MLGWWRRRRQSRERVEADASALIETHGDGAYAAARTRAHEARERLVIDPDRPAGHWDRVRREIGRRIGRDQLDTATRYVDPIR